MRNFLYLLGVVFTIFGAIATLDARAGSGTEIVTMLVVVCGVLLIVGAAIVGAIDALRRALIPPPVYPAMPMQPIVQR